MQELCCTLCGNPCLEPLSSFCTIRSRSDHDYIVDFFFNYHLFVDIHRAEIFTLGMSDSWKKCFFSRAILASRKNNPPVYDLSHWLLPDYFLLAVCQVLTPRRHCGCSLTAFVLMYLVGGCMSAVENATTLPPGFSSAPAPRVGAAETDGSLLLTVARPHWLKGQSGWGLCMRVNVCTP